MILKDITSLTGNFENLTLNNSEENEIRDYIFNNVFEDKIKQCSCCGANGYKSYKCEYCGQIVI